MGVMKASFEGLGWQVRLQQKRRQYLLTLAREMAIGNSLKKGDPLFYYFVKCNERKAILVFLDGQERPKKDIIKLETAPSLL